MVVGGGIHNKFLLSQVLLNMNNTITLPSSAVLKLTELVFCGVDLTESCVFTDWNSPADQFPQGQRWRRCTHRTCWPP